MKRLQASVIRVGYVVLIFQLAVPPALLGAAARPTSRRAEAQDVALTGASSPGGPIGRLRGRYGVTAKGEPEYVIPIEVAAGVNGVQPELAIRCLGGAPNGRLGIGCDLAGVSAINRCPRSYRVDGQVGAVRFSSDDALCRDGQRLLLAAGTQGADGSRYREVVNGFDELVRQGASDATATFSVRLASGLTLTYGGAGATVSGTPQGTLGERPRTPVTYAWLLRSVSDEFGNLLVYEYRSVPESACPGGCVRGTVEMVLDRIRYGGSLGGVEHTRAIVFDYATGRDDVLVQYVGGLGIRTSGLLRRVSAMVGDQTVRSYELTYDFSAAYRSRLRTVTACSSGECLEPTRFEWTEESFGVVGG